MNNISQEALFTTLAHHSKPGIFSKTAIKSLLGLILSITLLVACKSEPKFNPELLVGTWNGIDWKVQGKSSGRDASAVNFVFAPFTGEDASGIYMAAYGSQKESGSYKIAGDKLYTTAEDKIEKVVRIVTVNADTLVLGMNRMGQEEELVLLGAH